MSTTQRNTKSDATKALSFLRTGPFIGYNQARTMASNCYGEERQWFIDKLVEMKQVVEQMPKVPEQDGKGDDAVVHLHYFCGSADWYITEKDSEPEQLQAFGYADLGLGFPELGYINLEEVTRLGAELDLHFKPTTLGEVKRERQPAHGVFA